MGFSMYYNRKQWALIAEALKIMHDGDYVDEATKFVILEIIDMIKIALQCVNTEGIDIHFDRRCGLVFAEFRVWLRGNDRAILRNMFRTKGAMEP